MRLRIVVAGGADAHLDWIRSEILARGHELVGVADGAAALAALAAQRPDLVVLDLRLREGGVHAGLRALRALDLVRWVPIWCVGADSTEHECAAALTAGADAYFARPVSAAVFRARLTQVCAYVARQRQLQRRPIELQAYFEAAEEENKAARDILERLLRVQTGEAGVLRTWIATAYKFSGDAVVAERSPNGSLKLLVADGVGHGLSAALNVLPVARAFQSMAQKGFGLAALVTELNHTIRRDLPSHRFVAATLVNIDAVEGLIEVWNGGNPACVMVDRAGSLAEEWPSRHLPLGVVDSADLDPQPERSPLRPDCQLLLFSDGAVEALDDSGVAFGEAALVRALGAAAPEVRFEAAQLAVVEHLAGHPAGDDVTLVLVDCGAEIRHRRAQGAAFATPIEHAVAQEW